MSRVAFLTSQYPSAVLSYLHDEIKTLRATGLEVKVFSINPSEQLPGMREDELREIRETRVLKSNFFLPALAATFRQAYRRPAHVRRMFAEAFRLSRSEPRRVAFIGYLLEAIFLGELLEQQRIRHFHVYFANAAAWVARILGAQGDLTYSVSVHGPHEFFPSAVASLGEKLARAQFVRVISDFGGAELRRFTSFPPTRIVKAHCGVDVSFLERRVRAPRRPGDFRILSVGRLAPEKRPELIVRTAAALENLGHRFEWKVIGEGPERAGLERISQQKRLSSLSFTGALNHDQVLNEMADADVFVLTSAQEGIPVVLMEAMALGRLCIATRITGIPELIRHGQNGILVDVNDLDGFVGPLSAFFKKPGARLPEAPQEIVRREFEYKNETLKIYEWLIRYA